MLDEQSVVEPCVDRGSQGYPKSSKKKKKKSVEQLQKCNKRLSMPPYRMRARESTRRQKSKKIKIKKVQQVQLTKHK
jgi:hypothetical protein